MEEKEIKNKSDGINEKKKEEQETIFKTKINARKRKLAKLRIKRSRRLVVIIFLLFATILGYVLLRGSYLEMLELGENYTDVYWQNIKYSAITFIINTLLIFIMIYYTNKKIKLGLKEFFDHDNKKLPKLLNKSIAFIAAVIISAITSKFIKEKAILCFNSSQFGTSDAIFGIDIGFYVFISPFIKLVIWYFMIATITLILYRIIYYIVTFNVFLDGIDKNKIRNSKFIKQITNSIMILAVLLSMLIVLDAQNIATSKFMTLKTNSTTYSIYGAGFVDVHIKIWGYILLSMLIIISVYRAIRFFRKNQTRKMIVSMSIVPIYLLILFLIMAGAQILYVDKNEYDKEKKYISYNIKATKDAYGINIEEVSINETEALTTNDLKNYQEVLNNVAITDSNTVLKDLNNGQTAKGYYSYKTSQIGRYTIDGKSKLVYISPREIANSTKTYESQTYENTHGYGVIVTSATNTKENGNLDNIQKEFEIDDELIKITEPRIYYGVETKDVVVTNTSSKNEFDYPLLDSSNADNVENKYEGQSGLSLGFIDRLILAFREGDFNLVLSKNVTKDSKILINRNVIQRAKTILPYLKYDNEPYIVVTNEGKLIWVLDAYTISNNYPYSQKTILQETGTTRLELNYIRNSIKITIDAYDGTTKFYITDRTDPIAMAYYNMYPNLFVNIEESISEDISRNFVYPEYLYDIQAEMIARYHNVQPDVLYRGDDIWGIAMHNAGKATTKTGTKIEPYYTVVKTVNNDNTELGLILPYTIYGKQNLISYTIGTCNKDGSINLKIYKYQDNSNILGPMQLDSQLEEDETIKEQIDALNITGTKITKNIITVPLDNNILYVEPIYTQYINEINSLPTLKKVIVASGTKVAIGDNFQEALSNLVSRYAVDLEIENTDTVDAMIDTIIKANDNLTKSRQSNDLEMMGKDIQKLQDLIQKLQVLVDEENLKKEQEEEQLRSEETSMVDKNNVKNTIKDTLTSNNK